MKLSVSSGGVPVGSYRAKFLGVEPTQNDYGEGLRWKFQVIGGPHAGLAIARTTGKCPTPKNAAGKILSGLSGNPLTVGVEFDLATYVGKDYLVSVAEGRCSRGDAWGEHRELRAARAIQRRTWQPGRSRLPGVAKASWIGAEHLRVPHDGISFCPVLVVSRARVRQARSGYGRTRPALPPQKNS